MSKTPIAIRMSWSMLSLMFLYILISVGLLILTDGNLVAALVPSILLIAAIAIFTLPLRYTVFVFFAAAMLFHTPSGIPMSGKWQGPLFSFGKILYNNLNKITGIGALKVNVVQLATFVFLLVIVVRTLVANNIDGHRTSPANRSLKTAAYLSLGATILSVVWGVANGGNRSMIPLQMMGFAFAPLFAIIFMRSFKTDDMFKLLGKSLVLISVVRCFEGAYFYFAMVVPQGLDVEYIMTHDDSVLLVVSLMILLMNFIEIPNLKNGGYMGILGSIIIWGMIFNDRRVAYVSLGICLVFLYFFLKPPIRKKINRVLLYLAPVVAVYILVGLKSQSSIFAPVHAFLSVSDETDASNISRDIENLNLLWTLRQNAILGTGYGFEYSELIPSVPLSYDFYKYLAHNHIIWLGFLTGIFGFFFTWITLPVGTFLAYRSYIHATNSTQRVVSLVAVCAVITYMVQAYADMGATSYKASIVLYASLASVANLAQRIKAV